MRSMREDGAATGRALVPYRDEPFIDLPTVQTVNSGVEGLPISIPTLAPRRIVNRPGQRARGLTVRNLRTVQPQDAMPNPPR